VHTEKGTQVTVKVENLQNTDKRVVIIGAGPAGLTAAYELTKLNLRPIVIEKLDKVGGISRTEDYKGFYFDMGGHRFFTKSAEVNQMWQEVMGADFLRRARLSRIYYNHKFFYYPLKPLNTLMRLGLIESILIILSYLRWQLFPYRQEETFEQWVTNRFGKRLFLTFFKTYTEKVWGIPCSKLKAEWAAQRIKDLSFKTALISMFVKPKNTITTLIDQFDYPRRGPGMMWSTVKERVEERGGCVRMNTDVVKINRTENRIDSVVICHDGQQETIAGSDFISSMPLTEFIKKLDPAPPAPVLAAADKLTYRDYLTVCLIANKAETFPDNWIYVHDPSVQVGRIQNFKNWSPDMVPDQSKTSLGLEYFCTVGDELWNMSDADLVELGKREIDRVGLASYNDIEDGCVFRVPKAYPVYDSDYRSYLAVIRQYVDNLDNFQTIGRNGLHRYNNQDHAMLTGMYAVRNMLWGEKNDLWVVNADKEYHEEVRAKPGVKVPDINEVVKDALAAVFPKVDSLALGLSVGATAGIILFLATVALLFKGGDVIGPNLRLLNQFFPGYRITPVGSVIGLFYGLLTGFVVGWLFATLRNASVYLYMAVFRRRTEFQALRKFWDYLY
jgi:protoporphyrinogen oxidase